MADRRPRGRYAPTPSGLPHVGNARTALAAWLSVRSRGGSFVWRLEDLDGPRTVPGMADAARDDLAWLGLEWDEGGGQGGPCAPYEQSRRGEHYEAALETLHRAQRLFPCRLSRADLAGMATAPHGREGLPPYPAELRPRELPEGWFERLRSSAAPDAALRFRADGAPVTFVDLVYGEVSENVAETVGDFVLKRRDGLYAYQLAVVVDDLAMGIDEVVRGRDLLDSTARQIQLAEVLAGALGGAVPAYAHLPLVVNEHGEKLSKRDHGLTLRSLREAGVEPEALAGYLAFSLGLLERPEPCAARDLVPVFSWEAIGREDWRLPADLAAELDRLG